MGGRPSFRVLPTKKKKSETDDHLPPGKCSHPGKTTPAQPLLVAEYGTADVSRTQAGSRV